MSTVDQAETSAPTAPDKYAYIIAFGRHSKLKTYVIDGRRQISESTYGEKIPDKYLTGGSYEPPSRANMERILFELENIKENKSSKFEVHGSRRRKLRSKSFGGKTLVTAEGTDKREAVQASFYDALLTVVDTPNLMDSETIWTFKDGTDGKHLTFMFFNDPGHFQNLRTKMQELKAPQDSGVA